MKIAFMLLLCLSLTGCWDSKGIDQRAFVTMAGIDITENSLFRVTLQFPAVQSALGSSGGTQGTVNGITILSAEAVTIFGAINKLRGALSRDLDFSFLDNFVLGKEAAKDLGDTQFAIRSLYIPITCYVSVTDGKAEEIVRAKVKGYTIPSIYASDGYSGYWTKSSAVVPLEVWELYNRFYHTPLEDPYAPVLKNSKLGLAFNGIAIFKQHQISDFLNEHDASLFKLVKHKYANMIVEAQSGEDADGNIAAHLTRGKVKRKVLWKGGKPLLTVDIRLAGRIEETKGVSERNQKSQQEAESLLARKLQNEIYRFIMKLQQLKSDPIGFGELAREASPYRIEVSSRQEWQKVYQQADIQVTVKVKIEQVGHIKCCTKLN